MIAVIYHETGAIVQTITGSDEAVEKTARAMGCAWLAVAEYRNDYDATSMVRDGALVPKVPA